VEGEYDIGERNAEGQMIVDVAKRMGMAVVNLILRRRRKNMG